MRGPLAHWEITESGTPEGYIWWGNITMPWKGSSVEQRVAKVKAYYGEENCVVLDPAYMRNNLPIPRPSYAIYVDKEVLREKGELDRITSHPGSLVI